MSGDGLLVPPEFVDAVAQRVADILAERGSEHVARRSPWMDRDETARYIGWKKSRLEKDRTVPLHRHEGRVLYHREEVDAYLLGLGRDA